MFVISGGFPLTIVPRTKEAIVDRNGSTAALLLDGGVRGGDEFPASATSFYLDGIPCVVESCATALETNVNGRYKLSTVVMVLEESAPP